MEPMDAAGFCHLFVFCYSWSTQLAASYLTCFMLISFSLTHWRKNEWKWMAVDMDMIIEDKKWHQPKPNHMSAPNWGTNYCEFGPVGGCFQNRAWHLHCINRFIKISSNISPDLAFLDASDHPAVFNHPPPLFKLFGLFPYSSFECPCSSVLIFPCQFCRIFLLSPSPLHSWWVQLTGWPSDQPM